MSKTSIASSRLYALVSKSVQIDIIYVVTDRELGHMVKQQSPEDLVVDYNASNMAEV